METKNYQNAIELIKKNNWTEEETLQLWEREMNGDINAFMKKAMLCILCGNFEVDESKNSKQYSTLFIVTLFGCIDVYMYDNKISVGQFEYLIPLNYMRRYKAVFNALKQPSEGE